MDIVQPANDARNLVFFAHTGIGSERRWTSTRLLSDLTSKVQVYEALLGDICPKVDSCSAQYIKQLLDKQAVHPEQVFDRKPSVSSQSSKFADSAVLLSPVPTSLLGGLDYTNEDFNRDEKVQAIGFVGEHSEIAWLYRLRRMLDRSNPTFPKEQPNRYSVASVNFFLDNAKIPVIDNANTEKWPSQTMADQLVDNYFQVVHHSFPIIGKVIFLRQYKSFYNTPYVRPGKRWLAILNLVFAIAARYSRQILTDSQGAPDDDRVYFSRAWKLNMSEVALLDHPNLQQVQVEGLTSFYLSSVGQVNSCSHDFCTTPLPVPFREEEFLDENVIQLITDNESRSMFMERLAFSHSRSFLMDNATPGIHGHTLAIPGKQCEQIVSNAVETLTPNSSLYFLYLVDLGLIMRNTVDTLYAAGAARKSWREVEMAISTLNGRIDAWLERLPPAFHFTLGTLEFERQRLSLAFLFYSAKIIITQPCLSRLTRQISGTEAGSFCDATATMCVDLAIQMLDLLPDLQDTSWVYRKYMRAFPKRFTG
ncbi:hypothetical protein EYZ11_000971 [Aspergillus tanneri]|uniref:Transcription factor domain-containing protein n=1 Tax=Aspergillus tanneri TaxID=1220188 RepID=A0A4S3JVQ2_9EURO|nr:hypothetical protein EYZ11_000971 [Aspergillus tanneri]